MELILSRLDKQYLTKKYVKHNLESSFSDIFKNDIYYAIENGLVGLLKYLIYQNNFFDIKDINQKIINSVAVNGHFSMLKYLYRKWGFKVDDYEADDYGFDSPVSTIEKIVENGHIDIIKWLQNMNHTYIYRYRKYLVGYDGIISAIKNGQLDMIKYIMNNTGNEQKLYSPGMQEDYEYYINHAVKNGSMEMVKYFESKGYKLMDNEYLLNEVIENGSVEMLKWLQSKMSLDKEFIIDDENIWYAIRGGNVEMLKYLESLVRESTSDKQKLKIDYKNGIWHAAMNGHTEMIKYIESQGIEIPYNPVYHALHNGHLELFKYLYLRYYKRYYDMEFGLYNFRLVVKSDNIEMFKYLRKLRFINRNFDYEIMKYIASKGNLETFKYLQSEGVKISRYDIDRFAENIKNYIESQEGKSVILERRDNV